MQLDLFNQPQARDAARNPIPSHPSPISVSSAAASVAVLSSADKARLATLQSKVEALMADGEFRTLAQIHAKCGGTEASCSARLRECRANGCTVERRRISAGLFEYRVMRKVEVLK